MQIQPDVQRFTLSDRDLSLIFSPSAHSAMVNDFTARRDNAVGLCLGGLMTNAAGRPVLTVEDSLPVGEQGDGTERHNMEQLLKPLEEIIQMWLETPRLPGPVGVYVANCADIDQFVSKELPAIAKYLKGDVHLVVSVRIDGTTAEGEIAVVGQGAPSRVPVAFEVPRPAAPPKPVVERTAGGTAAAPAPALEKLVPPPAPATPPAAAPAVAVPLAGAAYSTATQPAPAATERKRSHRVTYAVALLTLVVIAGVMWWAYRTQIFQNAELSRTTTAPAVSAFDLRVSRSGGDLEVTWNRDAQIVRTAQHALLYINDGGQRTQLYLEPSHLKSGRVLYGPRSNDIDFQLEVATADDRLVRESVRVLEAGQPAGAAAGHEQTAPAAVKPISGRERAAEPSADPAPVESRRLFLPPPDRSTATVSPGMARIQMGEVPQVTTQASLTQRLAAGTQPSVAPPPAPAQESSAVPDIPRPVPFAQTPTSPILATDRNIPVPTFQAPAPVPAALRNIMNRDVIIETLLTIDARGHVAQASAGPQGSMLQTQLATVAVESAKRWRFLPATRDGKPVESRYKLVFRFKR